MYLPSVCLPRVHYCWIVVVDYLRLRRLYYVRTYCVYMGKGMLQMYAPLQVHL